MLVAPTEPRSFDPLGARSLAPERAGVDFFFVARGQRCGVQRKELKDFISSVHDGRLSKEIAQMAVLDYAMLVIEGSPRWSLDGELLTDGFGQRWTRAQHLAYLFSVRARGVWVEWSADHAGTTEVIEAFEQWAKKSKHRALDGRPGPASPWGRLGNRDYQRHLVMGLPGVGADLADRIIDTLGMPFGLCLSEEQLMSVDGIGKKKASEIVRSIGGIPA